MRLKRSMGLLGCCTLQPSFKVPSRNTIKKDIFQIYEEEKLKSTKALDQNGSRVAITSDMWTSNQNKGYMIVTAHYIDSSWKLQMRVLRYFSEYLSYI